MIDTKDIDVIIQGNLDERYIDEVCESVRKELAGSRIILSTWKEDIEKAECLKKAGLVDEYVISEDPGTRIQNYYSHAYINLDRQIISTKVALGKLTKKYTLKLRTDIKIISNRFLKKYESTSLKWGRKRKEEYRIFQDFVLVSSFYSRNPRIVPMPYHMSDWFAFGLTEDIKLLFDTELPEDCFYNWFFQHRKKTWLYRDYVCRYAAEQYYLIAMMKKLNLNLSIPNEYYDLNRTILQDSERVTAYNYVIDDYQDGSFRFLKYDPNRYADSLFCYKNMDLEHIRKYPMNCRCTDKMNFYRYEAKCCIYKLLALILLGVVSGLLRKTNLKEKIKKVIEKR